MENVKIITGKFLGKTLRYFIENDDLYLHANDILAILSLKQDALNAIEPIDTVKTNDNLFVNEFAFNVLKQNSKYSSTRLISFVEKLPHKSMQYVASVQQNEQIMSVVNNVRNLLKQRNEQINLMDELDVNIDNLDNAILSSVEEFSKINI